MNRMKWVGRGCRGLGVGLRRSHRACRLGQDGHRQIELAGGCSGAWPLGLLRDADRSGRCSWVFLRGDNDSLQSGRSRHGIRARA